MTMTRSEMRWCAVCLVVCTIAVSAPPYASAQQSTGSTETLVEAKPEDKGNTGRISLNFGVDWVSEYFFRGIAQQVGGANFQP
jgi:hypothetical protein